MRLTQEANANANTNDRAAECQLVASYVEELCGVSIPPDKNYLFDTRLTPLMFEESCLSLTELCDKARKPSANALRERIVDAMTTNETLWFRDSGPWSLLKQRWLPAWADEFAKGARRNLRFWSAACATGQEPYSIAIAVAEWNRENPLSKIPLSQVEILATDISSAALDVASRGRYDGMSLRRGLDQALRDRYFEQDGAAWVIDSSISSRIRFTQGNLLRLAGVAGGYDIVFCRNVLIYFTEPNRAAVSRALATKLNTKGSLVVGASESLQNLPDAGVVAMEASGHFYYVTPARAKALEEEGKK